MEMTYRLCSYQLRPNFLFLLLYAIGLAGIKATGYESNIEHAKGLLSKLWYKRHFEYDEIDVMKPGQGKWKDLYEFDTPVVHFDHNNSIETTPKAKKLMHRMTEAQVQAAMDEVESKR